MKDNNLTIEEKNFLKLILGQSFVLSALDYDYDIWDEKAFKETYGITIKTWEKALKKILNNLG